METFSMNEATNSQETKYATRDDFESNDQYANYVRGLITPGMTVRCCEDFEEIRKGDIGTVEKLEPEALHDLNVYVDWRNYGTVYWMRFVHIELVDAPPATDLICGPLTSDQLIMIGSHVRIAQNIQNPRYKWGSVPRGSIGVVTAINENGDVSVDFPQQFNWTGHITEMELVCQGNPEASNQSSIDQEPASSEGNYIIRIASFILFILT